MLVSLTREGQASGLVVYRNGFTSDLKEGCRVVRIRILSNDDNPFARVQDFLSKLRKIYKRVRIRDEQIRILDKTPETMNFDPNEII